MTDDAVRALADRAGVAAQWIDYADKPCRVPIDTLRRILSALGLPCETESDLRHSRNLLDTPPAPALVTADIGAPVILPIVVPDERTIAQLVYESGETEDVYLSKTEHGAALPGRLTTGYHTVAIGSKQIAIAIAPKRCITIQDLTPGERLAGISAQIYGLRSAGDCGIGDMGGVVALGKSAASLQIDALALSPLHALFTADPSTFSPYSPSNRLFYNPLHADPALVFDAGRVARARTAAGIGMAERQAEASALINWSLSSAAKLLVLRCLFDDFASTDLVADPATALATSFENFRSERGAALKQHAIFETLHGVRVQADRASGNWRSWSAEWQNPDSNAVSAFAEKNQSEVLFHMFLQWIADLSFAAAQQGTKQAGMRIGLISDLAVGMSNIGSHAWMNQSDILGGLEIGAPPDLFNASGQNWGLTTFSPRALVSDGYEPFIATLRACLRHAGGVRIDHAMGFMRLWVTPQGAPPSEGAYLSYPLDDLLRLTALESHRHRAIVIGEDLGTVPAGFRDRLSEAGIYGMGILLFERKGTKFKPPQSWPAETVAMTSTHDMPPVAEWWRGSDLDVRDSLGLLRDAEAERTSRRSDRDELWAAFKAARVDSGALPPPEDAPRITDDAISFVAQARSPLALIPLEDVLALNTQPNLPGTIDEHPNWRRRYDRDATTILDQSDAQSRVKSLAKRRAS